MVFRPEPRRIAAAALALLALSTVAATRPGDDPQARQWVEQGRQAYRSGDHFAALRLSRQAQARAPDDPRVLQFSAELVRDARGVVPALPLFERALAVAPDDLDLLAGYAGTLAEAGRHRDMLRVARRMVEIDPRDPRAYFLQAVLAARAGLDDLARRLLWKTGDRYAEVPAGMLLAGVLELRTGSARQAVDHFDALARRQPDNAFALALLGRSLLAEGDAGGVVARLRSRVDRAEAAPYLLTVVGRALEQLGRREEAAIYLDRAAGLPAKGLYALEAAGDSEASGSDTIVQPVRQALAEGRPEAARAMAEELAARFSGSADLARVLGDVRLGAGDPAGALAAYARAAEVRRDTALVERMSFALRLLGRDGEADALLSEHLAGNPRDRATARPLGARAEASGNWRVAAALLGHADRLGAGADSRLAADLAAARLAIGDGAGALEAAQRAHRLQRGSARAARSLAMALRANGNAAAESEALLAKAQALAQP